jgi:hypothetical protein
MEALEILGRSLVLVPGPKGSLAVLGRVLLA